jgi:hypothetical protein
MNEQRMIDMDRREFLTIPVMAAAVALAAALLPENVPAEDTEESDGDEYFWIGGY